MRNVNICLKIIFRLNKKSIKYVFHLIFSTTEGLASVGFLILCYDHLAILIAEFV